MEKDIIVAKFGSDVVCGSGGIEQEIIAGYVSGLIDRKRDNGLIVVSSGAIKAGETRLRNNHFEVDKYDDVTLAQLGCTTVMHAWESEFERHKVMAGGLLTTHHEIEDKQEGSMLQKTLRKALNKDVVSIINENDALSEEELMAYAEAADNDGLATLIAIKSGASELNIYTTQGGIYDDSGVLIEEINRHNYYEIESMLASRQGQKSSTSTRGGGRGGVIKKIQAAKKASMAGIAVSIMKPTENMVGENITRVIW
jgi:glutamate 5-kinase